MNVVNEVVFYAALAVGSYLVPKLLLIVYNFVRVLVTVRKIPLAENWKPIVGHTAALASGVPWQLMKEWVLRDPAKPIVRIQVLARQCVVVYKAAHVKQLLHTHVKHYTKDLEFSYTPFLPILGTGLVTSEGELWKKQRQLVMHAFRVEILDEIIGVGLRAAKRLEAKLQEFIRDGEIPQLSEEFRKLTLQVIVEALMSLPADEADKVFPQVYLPIMEEANKRVLAPWRGWFPTASAREHNGLNRVLNEYVLDIIQRRWDEKKRRGDTRLKREDILERVLQATMDSGKAWDQETKQQLAYEFKTFVLAGHETSAAMLTWALYELVQNPACMQRVRAEAEATFALARGEEEALTKLVRNGSLDYTFAVLKEALRKYSVVPAVTRTCVKDDQYEVASKGGKVDILTVPRGTTVILNIEAAHNDPTVWADPEKFDPERFLGDVDANREPYAFLPFIQGPRNCLGQHLALLEARVVLAYLVRAFDFRPVSDDEGERAEKVVPVAPAYGMQMHVTPRKQSS